MVRVNVRPSRLSNVPVHEPAATTMFDPRWELERLVLCCLLGERQFYVNGTDIEARIRELADQVDAEFVRDLAVKARREIGLRHVPLLLLIALANRRDASMSAHIQEAAKIILRTPRDAMDLVALYWATGKKPLPWSFKQAICRKFGSWTEFQIRRYGTLADKVSVRLRDLLCLTRPSPGDRQELFRDLYNGTITAPETWESLLPRAEGAAQKREVWTHLLTENKLGALALIRNLRNMSDVGVDPGLVVKALSNAKVDDVWPWQILSAARHAPAYEDALQALMTRSVADLPKIPGRTGILVDVSGSMDEALSGHSEMLRMDAGAGLAVVLREICDHAVVASFSNGVVVVRGEGIGLAKAITASQMHQGTLMGAAIKAFTKAEPMDRLIIATDEQSQDRPVWPKIPVFVVNLASYQRGVAFDGEVTRITGWSNGVMRYLAKALVPETVIPEPEDD